MLEVLRVAGVLLLLLLRRASMAKVGSNHFFFLFNLFIHLLLFMPGHVGFAECCAFFYVLILFIVFLFYVFAYYYKSDVYIFPLIFKHMLYSSNIIPVCRLICVNYFSFFVKFACIIIA